MNPVRHLAIAAFCASLSLAAAATDMDREQRLRQQVVDFIMVGEPVDLKAGPQEFLGLYTEASGNRRGAVLLLHGRGLHPAWPTVIEPLRTGLPERGWDTLSIQLPVLDKAAKYDAYVPIFPEAMPRIEAALGFLRQKGAGPVVMIAHSCGGHMAMHWIGHSVDQGRVPAIDAFVGLGMGATDYRQPMQEPFRYADLKVPALDVYGAQEYPQVIRMAPERAAQISKTGHPGSRQVEVPGADHYFHDSNEELLELVGDWLDSLKIGQKIAP